MEPRTAARITANRDRKTFAGTFYSFVYPRFAPPRPSELPDPGAWAQVMPSQFAGRQLLRWHARREMGTKASRRIEICLHPLESRTLRACHALFLFMKRCYRRWCIRYPAIAGKDDARSTARRPRQPTLRRASLSLHEKNRKIFCEQGIVAASNLKRSLSPYSRSDFVQERCTGTTDALPRRRFHVPSAPYR
jgi:hypothetical protein